MFAGGAAAQTINKSCVSQTTLHNSRRGYYMYVFVTFEPKLTTHVDEMASEEDSASELSSDEEVCELTDMFDVMCSIVFSLSPQLQIGLAQGTLKPGLIGKVAPPKTFTNNVVRLLILTGTPLK